MERLFQDALPPSKRRGTEFVFRQVWLTWGRGKEGAGERPGGGRQRAPWGGVTGSRAFEVLARKSRLVGMGGCERQGWESLQWKSTRAEATRQLPPLNEKAAMAFPPAPPTSQVHKAGLSRMLRGSYRAGCSSREGFRFPSRTVYSPWALLLQGSPLDPSSLRLVAAAKARAVIIAGDHSRWVGRGGNGAPAFAKGKQPPLHPHSDRAAAAWSYTVQRRRLF